MAIYPGRTRGTHRVVVNVGGKQTERIVKGTKKEAQAFEARLLLEEGAGRPSQRTAPTFEDFCVTVYRPHAETHLKASTWNKVRIYQIETLCEHMGSLKLSQFTGEAIEDFKKKRLAKKRKASSINNELRVLRTVLNWAKTLGYPVADFTAKRLPMRGHARVHFWTRAQLGALFASTQKIAPELLPMLVFLANTGCRKGEAIACEWSWIDLQRDMLRIPSNEVWQPKNGEPREVPIPRSLRAQLAVPESDRRHERWVFPNTRGWRYAEFPKDLFADVRKEARLTGGPHTLRHSFASMFLARRPDMFLLGQVLGHSHERVTALYSHLLPEHLEQARGAVDVGPTEDAPPQVGALPPEVPPREELVDEDPLTRQPPEEPRVLH